MVLLVHTRTHGRHAQAHTLTLQTRTHASYAHVGRQRGKRERKGGEVMAVWRGVGREGGREMENGKVEVVLKSVRTRTCRPC